MNILKMQSIVDYMEESGWEQRVNDTSVVTAMVKEYMDYYEKAMTQLCVQSIEICEKRYNGYKQICDSVDDPELLKEAVEKSKLDVEEAVSEMKELEHLLSELDFMSIEIVDYIKNIEYLLEPSKAKTV